MATRTVDQLRRGARIHSLLWAARLAKNPDRPYDVAWQRLNYTRRSATGARGTVCFSKLGAVGLFYDEGSAQAPARLKKPYRLEAHLDGIPEPLMQHARREALDAFVTPNAGTPVVTAAFWSDAGGSIVSARPWARVLEGGARLVAVELSRPEPAIATWCDLYALSPEQAAVARRLFGKSSTGPAAARVVLSQADRTVLGIITNQVTRELLEGAGVALG